MTPEEIANNYSIYFGSDDREYIDCITRHLRSDIEKTIVEAVDKAREQFDSQELILQPKQAQNDRDSWHEAFLDRRDLLSEAEATLREAAKMIEGFGDETPEGLTEIKETLKKLKNPRV